MRYYYKDANNNYYNLKEYNYYTKVEEDGVEIITLEDGSTQERPKFKEILIKKNENLIDITEEEFNQHMQQIKNKTAYDQNKIEIKRQINQLKKYLADTDYQAIKYAEGLISEEEYTPIKKARQDARDRINQLEGDK